jgi:hypothetical protein
MCNVYVIEGRVVKYSKDRYTTYPPREYQLKLGGSTGRESE